MAMRLLKASALLGLCLLAWALARDTKDNPATKPINCNIPRHKEILTNVAKGDADLIFIGDSITQGWEWDGKEEWKKEFAPLKPVNLGISGDQTGHVIWRITKGKELEPIKPKLAVVMIGTNNTGAGHSAEQTAGGIKAIVEELRKQKPDMKILLLGVFPRSEKPTDPLRDENKSINAIISKLDDGKHVFYKDISEKFLEKDGSLDMKIMPDFLHLSVKGYEIWGKAIKDDVQKLMK
jgi:lysophospholipase L1-like esterase